MEKNLLRIFVVLLLIEFSLSGSWANDKSIALLGFNPALLATFDKSIAFDAPNTLAFKQQGGRIVGSGISGNTLSLGKGEYLALDAKEVINPEEGTIAFWVRPNWSNEDNSSHTFISFSWDDERKGYFTISKGWWEKHGGQPYTYFIFNNADSAKTEKVITYTKGLWMHLACTWRTGEDGFVRLYADGLLAAEGYKKPRMGSIPNGELFIGADLGTPMSDGRWADAGIDEMVIFRRALSDEDILRIYNNQNPVERESARNLRGHIYQTRAIFDEGRGWMTTAGADETIRRIKRAGFNVYIPCVWHGQGTRYPSGIAPPEPNLDFKNYDPLEYLIELARKNGIEVHPWFTVMLRQREFLKDYYDEGTPKDAFNAFSPAFRAFIVHLMIDVVSRYDIDGINLDFIRSMGICSSNFCQEQYRQIYRRDLLKDLMISKLNTRLFPYIQTWVDNAVEEIVAEVSRQGKMLKPQIITSVDGHPITANMTPSQQGRNEVRWANKGLIDVIYNMDYRHAPDYERMDLIRRELNTAEKLIPLIANYEGIPKKGIKPRGGKKLAELTSYFLGKYPHGIGIYLYSQLTDEQVEALSAVLQTSAIRRPEGFRAQ
jgi:hypothetical protein